MRYVLAAVAALTLTVPAVAQPLSSAPCSKSCKARVKARVRAHVRHQHRVALRREMRGYRAAPMPSCTWLGESSWDPATGRYFRSAWARGRYLVKNPHSTASGKFQFLTSTWLAIGGGRYASEARWALPVYQERMARKLRRVQGLGAWANC